MREPYADAHERTSRRANTRNIPPADLRALLRWANHGWHLETPNLDHSQGTMDDGGDPQMRPAARSWVGLNWSEAMDWRRIACRLDQDGYHVTPIRCAIEGMDDYRRLVLRAIVPNPLEVIANIRRATACPDLPAEAALDTAESSLALLWRRVQDRPLPRPRQPGWVDKSDSQRAAEESVAVA